jgi:hypothetical protein
LTTHGTKIVALSAPAGDGRVARSPWPRRYASKNNLNMARMAWLARHVRDALLVIPFRDPLQHGASLLRQHLNFLALHRRDPFVKRYMAGVGHFEFGDILRPVDFDGWLDRAKHRNPKKLEFWLEYWCATYRSLLAEAAERVCFVDYDALCTDPRLGLERLARFLQVENTSAFLAQTARIRAPSSDAIDGAALDDTLVERAKALHVQLALRSMVD